MANGQSRFGIHDPQLLRRWSFTRCPSRGYGSLPNGPRGGVRDGPTVTEDDAVLLRRCTHMPVEACSYRGRSSEPGESAELFDRLVSRLKQYAGSIDASAGQPLYRRGSGLLPEPADERPARHVGTLCE